MHAVRTLTFAAAALFAVSGGVLAGNHGPIGFTRLYSTTIDTATAAGPPREVTMGEIVMIEGACLANSEDGEDSGEVHVVLSMIDKPMPRNTFRMLVTEQHRGNGKLIMRVPNIEQARNHTFRVRLFVGDNEDANVCEAGSIRIA